jgi:hypothetical protein
MRYSGAALGGSWLASMTADMGADRFDGAHLVENFEKLNPANTLWNRYYKLWSNIDTEAERFLEFEKWWGGFFRMTGAEIEAIVENLFVGNRLARGTVMDGDKAIDLRAITSPIVVFASHGDNITPVPQALDWIIDTWGDERAIAAAGRTIIYVLHESVGHLGIFVGGDIARKEHDQLVTSLDVIESLPPGLYEMKLEAKAGMESLRWEQLEPGDYTVHYEHRTMKDILALNPEGREEEALFSTISKVSELNATLYKSLVRPWVKLMATRPMADAMTKMHPLRMQRQMFSDAFPFASIIHEEAKRARANRVTVSDEHPLRKMEKKLDAQISESLNKYRDDRDASAVKLARTLYGPKGLGAWFKPDAPDSEVAHARALKEIEAARAAVITRRVPPGGGRRRASRRQHVSFAQVVSGPGRRPVLAGRRRQCLCTGLCAGLAGQAGAGHRALSPGRVHRGRGATLYAEAGREPGQVLHHGFQARCRHGDRHQPRGQGSAGRLHPACGHFQLRALGGVQQGPAL